MPILSQELTRLAGFISPPIRAAPACPEPCPERSRGKSRGISKRSPCVVRLRQVLGLLLYSRGSDQVYINYETALAASGGFALPHRSELLLIPKGLLASFGKIIFFYADCLSSCPAPCELRYSAPRWLVGLVVFQARSSESILVSADSCGKKFIPRIPKLPREAKRVDTANCDCQFAVGL